jgi:hypothetical protein
MVFFSANQQVDSQMTERMHQLSIRFGWIAYASISRLAFDDFDPLRALNRGSMRVIFIGAS